MGNLKLVFIRCQTQGDINWLETNYPDEFKKAWGDVKDSVRNRLVALPDGNATLAEAQDATITEQVKKETTKPVEAIEDNVSILFKDTFKSENSDESVWLVDPEMVEYQYIIKNLPTEIEWQDMIDTISNNLKSIGLIAKKQRIQWVRDVTNCHQNKMIWELNNRWWMICYLKSIHLVNQQNKTLAQ